LGRSQRIHWDEGIDCDGSSPNPDEYAGQPREPELRGQAHHDHQGREQGSKEIDKTELDSHAAEDHDRQDDPDE